MTLWAENMYEKIQPNRDFFEVKGSENIGKDGIISVEH